MAFAKSSSAFSEAPSLKLRALMSLTWLFLINPSARGGEKVNQQRNTKINITSNKQQ
jgi:hypothetical protein